MSWFGGSLSQSKDTLIGQGTVTLIVEAKCEGGRGKCIKACQTKLMDPRGILT